jgi:exosome complex exonuclease DIS3/RRP44
VENSEAESEDGSDPAEKEERRLLKRELEDAKPNSSKERQPTGKVVGIIKRNWRA